MSNILKLLLMYNFFVSELSQASTINVTASDGQVVNNAECSITEAIVNANNDAQTHSDCSAGNGVDTINLTKDVTLTVAYENHSSYGRTGTPVINSEIILDGNGYTLKRDSNVNCGLNGGWQDDKFRIIRTSQNADFVLQNITIAYGCADSSIGDPDRMIKGGGIYNEANHLSLLNVTFKDNKAFHGGGIFHANGNIDLISNSAFTENEVKNETIRQGEGGAIAAFSSIGDIIDSTFSHNIGFTGSGIYLSSSSIDNIVNSTFSEQTGFQGTLYNESSSIGDIINSTFSGNQDGAVNNQPDSSINLILNCTFSGNSSFSIADAISNSGIITTLSNTLFHNQSRNECLGNNPVNGSHNLSDDADSSCRGLLEQILTTNSVAPLTDNGGPTKTHALMAGSTAVDAADVVDATSHDQRGFSASGIRDIGAFEQRFEDVCPTALQVDGFTVDVSDGNELNQAIICSNLNGSSRDTIKLIENISYISATDEDSEYGRTALPPVSAFVTIDGQGHVLERDSSLTCNLFSQHDDMDEFRVLRTEANADVILNNISIVNGCADGEGLDIKSSGGGLLNEATLSLKDVEFKQNKARYQGGAVYHAGGILNTISNTLFVQNQSRQRAGAIAVNSTINTIENTTFSANDSPLGAALFNDNSVIDVIQNNTFSGNLGVSGVVIYNINGTLNSLRNNLFHDNGSSLCAHPDSSTHGMNNMSDTNFTGCAGTFHSTLTTTSVAPLADNGGPTMTHALLTGSEAIDAADEITATSQDQRGYEVFGTRDIGAYELSAEEYCAALIPNDGFTTIVHNGSELIKAIQCSNINGNLRDTIVLGQDISMDKAFQDDAVFGRTATPPIQTPLTLEGQGFVLERDSALSCELNLDNQANEFRLLISETTADLILKNMTIANGCADHIQINQRNLGGGLYNLGALSLEHVIFRQNQAYDGGGLAQKSDNNDYSIKNSLFVNNTASNNGGAIVTGNTDQGLIINSTFSGNVGLYGGAINDNSSEQLTILNSTFAENVSPNGGAFSSESNGNISILINNSLFVNNGNAECILLNGIVAGANNISDHVNSGCPGMISTLLSASSVSVLADYGGDTMVHALLAGSEAIDAADTVTNTGTATSVDQRGFNTENIRDIGAFESHVPVVVAPSDVVIEATGASTTVNLGTASVVDEDELGVTATADMTGPFSVGQHIITWTATDSQGFSGSDTQEVNVTDNTPPVIILNDSSFVNILIGESYNSGATASDLVDGEITELIIESGDTVDVNSAGTYVVDYEVTDSAGNEASISQTINVQALISVTISGLDPRNTIELTNNGDFLIFTSDGTDSFNPVNDGTTFAVQLTEQPVSPNQTCVLTGGSNNDGSGVISDHNVTVNVSCSTHQYFVGGVVAGIERGYILRVINDSDILYISEDGTFVFNAPLFDLESYDVYFEIIPDINSEECMIENGVGTIDGDDVVNVSISCDFTNSDLIFTNKFE